MKKLCNVMILTLVLMTGFLAEVEANYCAFKTYVFHSNGMLTEKWEAHANIVNMQLMMQEVGEISDDQWEFQLSYNHDEGIDTLFEVVRQRLNDQVASYWRFLAKIELAPDWFQSLARDVTVGFDHIEALIDEDLKRHVQRYQEVMLEGHRVIVVAHSQGNFYANSAYANLAANDLPMDAFGIVSVANPASYVAGGGPYFTLVDDVFVNAVRVVLSSTLSGNIDNSNESTDWTHHNFIDSYLNGNQSGPLIINTILSEANALMWPPPLFGRGPITVTLTWGEQPDLDLHVFEPSLEHVYYSNVIGMPGVLSRDDVDSYGPEHYFVNFCSQVETGRYRVAVNYYRGEGPETARVQIMAGDIVRNYSVLLETAYGSAGNSTPTPVANIDVVGDTEQGYVFTVSGL